MKKFLIASTALVALSGAAAAEITLSGDAQFSMKYDNRLWDDNANGGAGGTTSGVNVQSRARLTVTMTGETDSGLSFGAKFRPGHSNYTESRDNFSSVTTVWAEGSYGKLTVGDVDSAIEQAIGDLPEIGASGLEFYNEIFYIATDAFEEHDNKGVAYTYKFGDAEVFATFEDAYYAYGGTKWGDGNSWSVGAKYSMNQYSFGIGYSSGEDFGDGRYNSWGISAEGEFNGFTGKFLYVESKDDYEKVRQIGLGGTYTLANGIGLQGFYRTDRYSWDGFADGNENTLGLGASYDLGGGAEVKGGIVYTKWKPGTGVNTSRTIADVGLKFKF